MRIGIVSSGETNDSVELYCENSSVQDTRLYQRHQFQRVTSEGRVVDDVQWGSRYSDFFSYPVAVASEKENEVLSMYC